ncbi:MAG: LysM domain [Solirubrobacterales bacterium]|jgi:LysM repeat protein|nr:LysM domain [Solirubrobacterales bacterium]
MTDRPPNQFARFIAVGGLVVVFVAVIVVIGTSGGSSNSSGSSNTGSINGSTSTGVDTSDPRIQRALQNGIYVVQNGDTLTSISDATGISVDTIITLNPTTDPQLLVAGTHLKLK